MQLRLGKRYTTALLIAGSLLLAYLLFCWLAFEPLFKWAAAKVVADRSAHRLTVAEASLHPFRLALRVRGLALADPKGAPLLQMQELYANFSTGSIYRRAWVFDELRTTQPVMRVELRADGRLNWQDLLDAFANPNSKGLPRLLLQRCVLEQGRIDLVDQRVVGGFQTQVDPLNVDLQHLSTLPEDSGDYGVAMQLGFGAKLRWKGRVALNPMEAEGEVAVDELSLGHLWPYMQQRFHMAPPEGSASASLAYRVSYADRQFNLQLERLNASVDKLALRGKADKEPAIALDALKVSGGKFDLATRQASIDELRVNGGRLAIELADGRPRLLDWLATVPTAPVPAAQPPLPASAAASAAPATAAPWRLALARTAVEAVAVQVLDGGFVTPATAQVGRLDLQFKTDVAVSEGATQVQIGELQARLADVGLISGTKPPWLQLKSLQLQDGSFNLADHAVALGRVALDGGQVEAVRDAQGALSVLEALRRDPRKPAAAAAAASAVAVPWHYRLGKLEATRFAVALRDESYNPAVSYNINDLQATADGLSDDLKAQVPVRVRLSIKEGGRFEADGQVSPAASTAELKFKLDDLALVPVQPAIAQRAHVVLADGRVHAQGRVRVRDGKLSYIGGFAVNRLRVNEAATGERLVAWRHFGTRSMTATNDGLRIPDLTLDGLGGKLVIYKDRTVNLARALKPVGAEPAASAASAAAKTSAPQPPPATARAAAPTRTAAATAPAASAASGPAYRIAIDRLRVTSGELAFADLSLALPFGARIRDLQGHMNGLSNTPGAAAQLELDGKVDEFGLARAAGQLDLFKPTDMTDIKVAFRNIEMTSLTPYSATFAGRKIESGKLTLDLEYKVEQRKLVGDNRVVMDKLKLGERVEGGTYANLPLDLAIAILEDSNGKIDLGLPVSGSLDDPQFSYGAIVWKAIVNVITKIVSAPFRALGAAMGIGGDTLDQIVFDAGAAELLPPEREKLANLAKLMAQRPGIALQVPASYDAKADRAAISGLRLRRAVAQQNGRTLRDGEDPGPISTAEPATRTAVERLYAQRYSADALKTLQQRHRQANPGAEPSNLAGRLVSRFASAFEGTPPPLSADEAAKLQGADLHGLMVQRLIDDEPVDDALLRALADRRSAAIRDELIARGVTAERVRTVPAAAVTGERGSVAVVLQMAPGAKVATAASPT